MLDLESFGELSRAESEFVEACQSGEACIIGEGTCPESDDATRVVRGDLVRFFALGGSDESPLHDSGIELKGAVISGRLDLSGSDSDCDLSLNNCRFQRQPRLRGTNIRSLDFSGSRCPGIDAEGLSTEGKVAFRDGFHSTATIRLVRAKIGADLDCAGAFLDVADGEALNGDGSEIGGSIFLIGLREDDLLTPFRALGTVRFVSANIGDSVMAIDAGFDSGEAKYALSLALATIRRQLTLKNFHVFRGRLNLSGASTYSLNDDPSAETAPSELILNGFEYVHFSAKAPMDMTTRLDWLARQNPKNYGQDFWLQPYSQLARTLSAAGHEGDSREVLVEKEMRQGEVALGLARRERRWFAYARIWLSDRFMRFVIGYGYRPQRSLYWMAASLVAISYFFHMTYQAGDMTPAAPPILVSSGWAEALDAAPVHTAQYWGSHAGKDYETFHPFAYAFDLFVPLVDLGQESAWGPSTERGPLGRVGWWLRWVMEVVGWVVTALAAAAVTGLVRRG